MKRLILILATLLLCSSAWAATKVQVMTGGKIDVDKLPTIDFSLETDPASPEDGRIWWNETEKLLKIADPSGVYTFNGTLTAWDTTPAAFSFTDVVNATTNSTYTSNAITVSGINHPAAISVSGDASAKYSVNNATAVSTSGTVSAGDEVRAVVTSSAEAATAVNATVFIGGLSDAFSVTTAADVVSSFLDDFDTDSTADYTVISSTGGIAWDSTNKRVKGLTDNIRQGARHNTSFSGDYYVQGLVGPSSIITTRMGIVANCNGSGGSSTGFDFTPDQTNLKPYKFGAGLAGSRVSLSSMSYSGGKTWVNSSSSHLVRVEVRGSAMTVFIDWNNDGDFADADEEIGTLTDSSYSGDYGGFSVYAHVGWIDNFEMGDL